MKILIAFAAGVGVGMVIGKRRAAAVQCAPEVSTAQSGAQALLRTHDVLSAMRQPVLIPLSRGQSVGPAQALDLLNALRR